MERDLTRGSIRKGLVLFQPSADCGQPASAVLQYCGYLGSGTLPGQRGAGRRRQRLSLMTLLTSLLLGLCMGSGVVMSQLYGQGGPRGPAPCHGQRLRGDCAGGAGAGGGGFALLDSLMVWMRVPAEAVEDLRGYLQIIFWGIGFTFLYNFLPPLCAAWEIPRRRCGFCCALR